MATILKSKQPEAPPAGKPAGMTGLAGFNLDDFAQAGVRHLKAVEAEAAAILQRARQEAEAIRQRAVEEGQATGYAAGMETAAEEIRQQVAVEVAERIPALEAATQQISDVQEAYLSEYRRLLVSTVLAATERLVLSRLDREPEMIERWAEVALTASKTASRLTIAVHPETLVQHGETFERLLTAPGMPEDSRIEPDESVEPSGVVVRSEAGVVEMTLSRQLERLDAMLRGDQEPA